MRASSRRALNKPCNRLASSRLLLVPIRTDRPVASRRSAELAVAAVLFILGAVVMIDSVRVGIRWVEDGPQAGYFPFYVGLLLCLASLWNLARCFFWDEAAARRSFVGVKALKLILSMLLPTIVYVVLIGWIGFYVASILFIGLFMIWLGKYSWLRSGVVATSVSIATFLLFEIWFRVPLPKGPIEALLGLA